MPAKRASNTMGGIANTVNVGPGSCYGAIWETREPGQWLLHCSIDHHMTYNNVEEAGQEGRL